MAICWRKDLSVGDDKIDDDHKQILMIINEYEQALLKKDIVSLKLVFENLMRYAQDHFKREEELMYRTGYVFANQHAAHHTELSKELKKFHQNLMEAKKIDIGKSSAFLKRWLVDHIIAEDLKYKDFIESAKAERPVWIMNGRENKASA